MPASPILLQSFYKQFMQPGDLVYDVGANIGNRTEVFLDLGAKVVAIEPQPNCVAKLRQKFEYNPQCAILQLALGSREGMSTLNLTRTTTIASMNAEWIATVKKRRFKKYNWDEHIEVKTATLDCLMRIYGTPTFIKIDVEGYEYEVLKGLSQPVKALSFEFVPEIIKIATDCVAHLSSLGVYEFNWSQGESMHFEFPEWLNAPKIKTLLIQTQGSSIFGDVYARQICK